MVNIDDLLSIEVLEDKSSKVRYKLSYGETSSEAVYLERTLTMRETRSLMAKLSEIVDSYSRG